MRTLTFGVRSQLQHRTLKFRIHKKKEADQSFDDALSQIDLVGITAEVQKKLIEKIMGKYVTKKIASLSIKT